jgi:hypothetical protein
LIPNYKILLFIMVFLPVEILCYIKNDSMVLTLISGCVKKEVP